MKREMTCIICPVGCRLVVAYDENSVLSVTGNTCPRGKAYAETECTHPMRTVTTTVRTQNGGRVAVKTDRPIPKEHVFDCMQIINTYTAKLPVHVGDVLIENVFGANVVATANGGRA